MSWTFVTYIPLTLLLRYSKMNCVDTLNRRMLNFQIAANLIEVMFTILIEFDSNSNS